MKQIKNKNIKWWVGIGSCLALFLVIGIFAYSKMCFIIKGVEVIATVEKENAESPIATIEGKADNAIHLSLNGREIFIDKDGSFSEKVALLPGFSVVTLNAEDKFGNKKEKRFELVYKENAESIAFKKGEDIIN